MTSAMSISSSQGPERTAAGERRRLAVVILNYRTPGLVIDCLASLVEQLDPQRDVAVVVDNGGGDDSVGVIENEIQRRSWSDRAQVFESPVNGGFSAGNNFGIQAVDAEQYLLLNSDTLVRPGALSILLEAAEENPGAGLIGPALEWPDGVVQVSAFRFRTPVSEFIDASLMRLTRRLLRSADVSIPLDEIERRDPDWLSFAGVLIRRRVFDAVGLLDAGFFMYCEDIDFCRRAADAGWKRLYHPKARVVHLRGGSSSVKSDSAGRRRMPRYYYESRSRYFRKHYGRAGLLAANLLWQAGALIAWGHCLLRARRPHHSRWAWLDNWIGFLAPEATEGSPEEARAPATRAEAAR